MILCMLKTWRTACGKLAWQWHRFFEFYFR